MGSPNLFEFELSSPFKSVFESKVYWVSFKALKHDEIMIKAGAENDEFLIKPCVLKCEYDDDKIRSFYIGTGVCRVVDGKVFISAFPIKNSSNYKDFKYK